MWGASYWRFIHLFSFFDHRETVTKVKNYIPCNECKSEWYDPSPTENLLDWSREFHNKVNKKLGKYSNWNDTDLRIFHKTDCDLCKKEEDAHFFPWVFIHYVAMQPNSMEFLKEFNSNFPCKIHKGNLLDEPKMGESTIDWVLRNTIRFYPDFIKPAYFNQDIPILFDTSGNSIPVSSLYQ